MEGSAGRICCILHDWCFMLLTTLQEFTSYFWHLRSFIIFNVRLRSYLKIFLRFKKAINLLWIFIFSQVIISRQMILTNVLLNISMVIVYMLLIPSYLHFFIFLCLEHLENGQLYILSYYMHDLLRILALQSKINLCDSSKIFAPPFCMLTIFWYGNSLTCFNNLISYWNINPITEYSYLWVEPYE